MPEVNFRSTCRSRVQIKCDFTMNFWNICAKYCNVKRGKWIRNLSKSLFLNTPAICMNKLFSAQFWLILIYIKLISLIKWARLLTTMNRAIDKFVHIFTHFFFCIHSFTQSWYISFIHSANLSFYCSISPVI